MKVSSEHTFHLHSRMSAPHHFGLTQIPCPSNLIDFSKQWLQTEERRKTMFHTSFESCCDMFFKGKKCKRYDLGCRIDMNPFLPTSRPTPPKRTKVRFCLFCNQNARPKKKIIISPASTSLFTSLAHSEANLQTYYSCPCCRSYLLLHQ